MFIYIYTHIDIYISIYEYIYIYTLCNGKKLDVTWNKRMWKTIYGNEAARPRETRDT